MIDIQDLNLLRITKVKEWAICFDYGEKHYLLHGQSEMGEGSWQVLYERTLNECGKYHLERIKESGYATEYVANDYIKRQKGKTIVYSKIDKEYFAYKMTKRGFAIGIMQQKVEEENKHILSVEKQIKELEQKIYGLRREIAHLK